MDFQVSTLGQLVEFYNGKGIKPGGAGEFPVYGSNGLIGSSDEWLHENAIIIGRVGAYCGSVKYCPNKFWASDNTIVVTPIGQNADICYFYYLLQYLQLNKYAGGAAQPLVTQTVLKQVPVKVANPPTQRRISSILSAYDDLIVNNTRRIAILEELAQRIYEEWFINFRFPGHEAVRLVESKLGLVPEGWEVRSVGASLTRLKPREVYKKDSVAAVGRVIIIDQSEQEYLGFHNEAADFDACDGNPVCIFGDHTCKLMMMTEPFSIGPNTVPFIAAEGISTYFVYQAVIGLIQTQEYKRHWSDFCKKEIIIPSPKLMKYYAEAILPMRSMQRVLRNKIRNLRTARDFLLPHLISGELDVSTLPMPEEACA